jgi:hypothetical protein
VAAPWILALYVPIQGFFIAGPLEAFMDRISSRALAQTLVTAGGTDARVVAVRCFPTGIDWYMNRIVPVVTENGSEITSTYVARNFDALRAHSQALWTARELDERRARGEVDFLITAHGATPEPSAVPLGDFHKYRLWRIPRAPAAQKP